MFGQLIKISHCNNVLPQNTLKQQKPSQDKIIYSVQHMRNRIFALILLLLLSLFIVEDYDMKAVPGGAKFM